MRPLIVFGNPGDKRTGGIQQARQRLGQPPALIVPYAGLLEGRTLEELLAAQQRELPWAAAGTAPPLLRLDSPGGSFETEQALIALGSSEAGDVDDGLHPFGARPDPRPLGLAAAGRLKPQPGVLHHPSQWFRGYCRMLARLQREAADMFPQALWINDPAEIAAMTDKRRAQQILAGSGVPIPRPLEGGHGPADYASLREAMSMQRMHRIFIKLACGSAASGVIAYQINPTTGAEIAITTVGVEDYITRPPLYYNSGKLRRYTDTASISGIIDWLCRHGAYAEQWIPKTGPDGRSFDVRQLVVNGEACHAVARVSRTPITNLHLRSKRMSLAEAGLGEETRSRIRRTAEAALAAFPLSAIAGIDVLVSKNSQQPYVADVNPFGDLLYEVDYRGYGTYEWEMKVLAGPLKDGSP
ncbi:hypothetical protein GCM10010912_51560 [Paenibacillus albidus]|uniref:ATP-grasp domain-containing protein n=1 Tax=Paenibacillus albidus TaxID=2041023 RepID=A0A917CWZ3_9BACL|nr:STM4014 family protein [Paenibacillus albidus]GGG00369.1 hypothetical protein GCM10010912_51560 [Paenibacillus albidus]